MPASAEDIAKGLELLKLTKAFIAKQQIAVPETIYQTDRVIENAYGFIEDLANVAGYHQVED